MSMIMRDIVGKADLAAPDGADMVGARDEQNNPTSVSSQINAALSRIKYAGEGRALIPRTAASELYAIGDSQTEGANAATGVDYTDGAGKLLPPYRWPNILANLTDSAMVVQNFAICGQRLGWNASGGANWSIFNQMGRLGPYGGGVETPHVVAVMGGWNSVNPYSTTEEFFYVVRRSHEANVARLLVENWGGITHLGWADPLLGGQGAGVTPGFVTSAGLSESVQDTVADKKMSFNPFFYGDINGGRWVTRLTNGQYSQITLTGKRACAVFLETDPVNEGRATISVNGLHVAHIGCHWTSTFNNDRWPLVVWLENLPENADIRVECEAGLTKSVRLLAFGWISADSGIARRRSILYGSTVGNTANQHDPAVLYACAMQAESAVGLFAEYGVKFANPFNHWIESEDQEPQDISHLTPAGNARVAKAFLAAAPVPFRPSPNFIRL